MERPEVKVSNRDPYRAVVAALFGIAAVGSAVAIYGGIQLANAVLLAVALLMGLSAGVLAGVWAAQTIRMRPKHEKIVLRTEPEEVQVPDAEESAKTAGAANSSKVAIAARTAARLRIHLTTVLIRTVRRFGDWGPLTPIRLGISVIGTLAICILLRLTVYTYPPDPWPAGIAAAVCLIGAGIAATAVRYLGNLEPGQFPESVGLRRGARAVGWILVLAAVSLGLAWAGRETANRVIFYAVMTVNVAICYGLFVVKSHSGQTPAVFPLDLGVLTVLGERTNILGSILDAAERQLGIDLRSTWALTVIRRSLEPLILGLCLAAWLSTCLTVVGMEEQGLVERLGIPVGGPPLYAGLHVHLPWPIDKVFRIPVRRVQLLEVGHEGVEEPGPEDVLWAVEHAPNEFTLVLGNGRDLITVDAGVQFRIKNAAAWRYNCQNPAQALSAIAYRAVMRNTVNLTLSDALSQNVALLTQRMRTMIQSDADAMNLGVEVLGFTVGGMHPPVPVAKDYQGVVSAELRKVTTVVNAQVYRARILPEAEGLALVDTNTARAEGAEAMARAAGEAWSFRTLESQYRSSPSLYFFRRRLETLEKGLDGREFTILDSRFQRDGGEVWLTP